MAAADALDFSAHDARKEKLGGSGTLSSDLSVNTDELARPLVASSVPELAAPAKISPAFRPVCCMPGENPAGDPFKIGICAGIAGCLLNVAAPGTGTFCLSCIGGSWRGIRYGLATFVFFFSPLSGPPQIFWYPGVMIPRVGILMGY